ncbi:MAG TPA: extracellular solute-binding protein [bacterium]|nr:extracellular solute-binding protein [bacterium]
MTPLLRHYGFRLYSSDWIYHSLFKQFGSDLFSPDDKKAIFNNKEGKQAFAFWQKMVDDKVAIYISGKEGSAMDSAGKIGMVPRSTGSLHWYLDNATFDFGVAPFTLGKHKAVSLGGTNVYLFNKSTDIQQSTGWKLLSFMTNKENLTHFALNTGYMTSRKSLFESPEIQKIMTDDPRFRVTYDQLVYSFPAPKVGPFSEINDIIHDVLDRIILEGESVDILD